MALSRARRREPMNYWPGFVDALSTLLLVFTFLLAVFVMAQYFLSRDVGGKDKALAKLNRQIEELTDLLTLEKGDKAVAAEENRLAQRHARGDAPRSRRAGGGGRRRSRPGRARHAKAAFRQGAGDRRPAQPADRRAAQPARGRAGGAVGDGGQGQGQPGPHRRSRLAAQCRARAKGAGADASTVPTSSAACAKSWGIAATSRWSATAFCCPPKCCSKRRGRPCRLQGKARSTRSPWRWPRWRRKFLRKFPGCSGWTAIPTRSRFATLALQVQLGSVGRAQHRRRSVSDRKRVFAQPPARRRLWRPAAASTTATARRRCARIAASS